MTFEEHSPEVLQALGKYYHEAVCGPISQAILNAMRFGYQLAQKDFATHSDIPEQL